VWELDSDEVYKEEDLYTMDNILTENRDRVDMVSFYCLNFYHDLWTIGRGGRWDAHEDPIRRIFKKEPGCYFATHWPPTVVYPNNPRDLSHLEAQTMQDQFGIVMYHYSYVTRKQVEEKIEYYNRKGYGPVIGTDLTTWYERVWSKWTGPGCEVEKLYGSHPNTRRPTWTERFTGTHPEVMKSHPLYNTDELQSSTSEPGLRKERHGTAYGGWWICPDGLNPDSTVYSFGIGEDISFDLSVIDKYGVTVEAFDPTPRSLEHVRRQNVPALFHVHDTALAAHDGEELFYPPENVEHVSHTLLDKPQTATRALKVKVQRLSTIMETLGHDRIDILKMDIEGSEYEVIRDILDSKIDVDQILVEFHHNTYPGITVAQTQEMVDRLVQAGYDLFKVDGADYCFIRNRC
ncbi:MAG: FkbM family methyltransferase, partial [Armatimonadetes bacterium]|nr:FkbM family methyltransferase [Armatimonadota bacterium]